MEAVLASEAISTDVLPSSLSYGLDPSGSFVTAKRDATCWALGNSYSPAGVKHIQLAFGSSHEWLVPESVIFNANLINKEAKPLQCVTPDPNALFERMDIRVGGVLVESVTDYARCNTLFTRLTMSPTKRLNLEQLGFGTQVSSTPPEWDAAQNHVAAQVGNSATKRIFWKLNLSALFSQHRWLPLYALSGRGIEVNFFLASFSDSLIANGTTNSMSYELIDVQAKCSMCTLDDSLQDSFNQQLLQGSALRLNLKKVESIMSYIPASSTSHNFDVAMSRSYTRLDQLYATFFHGTPSATNMLADKFYVPASAHTKEHLAWSLQMGTKRTPDNDSVGLSESWYRTMECIGIAGSLAHSNGITRADYESNSFVVGISTEKIPHLASSGENLSNTSTLFVKFKDVGSTSSDLPSQCQLIAVYSAILEIRDTTCEIFE